MHPDLPNVSSVALPWRRVAAATAVALTLAACATRQPVPVEERGAVAPAPPTATAPSPPPVVAKEAEGAAPTYTVKRGDTLAQIALDNGLDYKELAAWNNVENPNVIRVGQVLRLTAPGTTTVAGTATTAPLRPPATSAEPRPAVASAPSARGDNVKSSPKALREPYSDHAVREVALASAAPIAPAPPVAPPAATPAPGSDTVALATPPGPKSDAPRVAAPDAGDDDRLDWSWPAKGKVVGGFSESANLKGIDIAGAAGQPVLASAAGKVVYAGNGLRGYGKLIIIKHNKTYLSAYAHNRELLVKEGDQVAKGQKIAEMGNTDADQVKLHFEIRRLGKPMDPARYLPPA